MIILEKISLKFGDRKIFDNISLNINKDNRIALVGKNGSGKSTLLRIIAGDQTIDSGKVNIEKGTTVGYMPQEVVLQSNKNIYDEALSAFPEIHKLLEECEELEKRMEDQSLSEFRLGQILERYAHVQEELIESRSSDAKVETKKILTGLGFSQEQFDAPANSLPVDSLSVGWKMRLVLAKLLLKKAHFYLFDEPTNHLDITTKEWFANFLKESKFGFILICHDRYFLDYLCSKTIEIEHGKLNLYHGNYTFYEDQKELLEESLEKRSEKQQKELSKKMKTVERFRASASKAKMAQSMLKKIDKTQKIETHRKTRKISLIFPETVRSGKIVLKAKNISHSFKNKQINKEVFKNVSFEITRGEKVAIVAPNGVGKTTLFNILTKKLTLQNGTVNFGHNVIPALFEQDQDKVLNKKNTIIDEIESSCENSKTRALVRKFLGTFLFSGDDVNKKIEILSGGEKNRVAMTKVLLQEANFLMLDEPTNHLDIESKEILLSALKQFRGTILFVTHDRSFLESLATRILKLSDNGIVSYPGDYESYLYQKINKKP